MSTYGTHRMLTHSILFVLLLVGTVSCFPQSRVANGTDSDIRKFPFLVSVRGPDLHMCGGTIVAPKWILTAATCTHKFVLFPSTLSIQYGVTVISRGGPTIATVKRVILHKNFTPLNDGQYDISLLELDAELVYNYDTIAPVTLPAQNFEIPQVPQGAPGTLIGWGSSRDYGPLQLHMQEVDLKIYSDEDCSKRVIRDFDNLCGGVDEGGKNHCSGDKGGPLLYEGSVQLGIATHYYGSCASNPRPGVYTKVSYYVDWIHEHIN